MWLAYICFDLPDGFIWFKESLLIIMHIIIIPSNLATDAMLMINQPGNMAGVVWW